RQRPWASESNAASLPAVQDSAVTIVMFLSFANAKARQASALRSLMPSCACRAESDWEIEAFIDCDLEGDPLTRPFGLVWVWRRAFCAWPIWRGRHVCRDSGEARP